MGMLIWYGGGDEDAVSLGDPGMVWKAFGEIAGVLGDDTAFDELQSVPVFAEQTVTPWWLGQAKEQAARCLREHQGRLSDQAKGVLTALANAPDVASAP